jgi:hypothetical protein
MLICLQIHTHRSIKECSFSESYFERYVYHSLTLTGMLHYSHVHEVVTVVGHCFIFRVSNGIKACFLCRNQG